MKRIFTFLGMISLPFFATSQITIDQSSYSGWQASEDSVYSFSSPANIPNLSEGADQEWDLSSLNYASSGGMIVNRSGNNSAFTDATYYTVIGYSFTEDFTYTSQLWGAVTANGIEYFGEEMDRYVFGLGGLTMNPNDSVVLPEQTIPYSSSEKFLSFPASYNSSWTTDYKFTMNFNITIALAGLNNAPGERRSHVVSNNEISGWGTMNVKNPHTGNMSDSIEVLQVKRTMVYTDSFYINGAPVSSTNLGMLGLQQGMQTSVSTINYYRMGEITPLVGILYSDNSFTTATDGTVHTEGVGNTISLGEVKKIASPEIYPNPVTGHTLNIRNNSVFKKLANYAILNSNGQAVAKGDIDFSEKSTIEIDPSLPAGNYFLSIGEPGKAPFIRSFILR